MTKGSTQENVTIANVSTPNTGAPQCIRHTLPATKGQISSRALLLGDCRYLRIS